MTRTDMYNLFGSCMHAWLYSMTERYYSSQATRLVYTMEWPIACRPLYRHMGSGGDLAPSLGAEKIFGPNFLKQFPFSRQKFLMTCFSFSHRPGFFGFSLSIPRFSISWLYYIYVKCRIWPFPHKKNTLFHSVHTFACIRQHYFSQYWEDECMGRPQPQILGVHRPSPPLRSPPLHQQSVIQTDYHSHTSNHSHTGRHKDKHHHILLTILSTQSCTILTRRTSLYLLFHL